MKESALVSILIPVYNQERYIAQCIESAINQTYKNTEIIVVDNHSTDNTWNIINKYSSSDRRIKAFQNDSNIGPVRNWKCCIDKAKGEYGKILWSDDYISHNFIEHTLPFLLDQSVGFVFTAVNIFSDNFDNTQSLYHIGETSLYESMQFIEGTLFEKGEYPVSPGCALFRLKDLKKNLLIEIPNKKSIDFSMHAIGPDLLVFLLTLDSYNKFAFINEALSFFRVHDQSITVSSDSAKITLYYSLAMAYFIEKAQLNKTFVKRYNALLKIRCIKHYNNSTGLNRINDFYKNNKVLSIDYGFFFKSIFSSAKKFLCGYFKKIITAKANKYQHSKKE